MSYLQALFRHLPAGKCAWYGYSEQPFADDEVRAVVLQDFDPGWCIRKLFRPRVVLDSSTVFLEYFDERLLKRWLPWVFLGRIRWVKVVHDTNLPERFARYDARTRRWIRFASRFVWRHVAVNEELARWLGENLVPPHRVHMIPSLIEVPGVSQATVEDVDFQTLRAGCRRLVCAVGAMNPEYGFQDVVAAVRRLQERDSGKVGLVLMCTGFAGEAGFLEQLQAVFPELLVLENLPHDQALAVMRDCDVVVRAVRSESYGLSRVESISQGTPVVATLTGETRVSRCYAFGDVDGLVDCLRYVLTDDARQATRQLADRFSKEAEANLQALLELLDRAARRR